jgi:PAS domain S-box-containing protein
MARKINLPLKDQSVKVELRDSETKFRILAEMAASAIFIYQDMRLRYVNPATASLTDYSRDELLGMNFYDLFSADSRKKVRAWETRLKKGGVETHRDEFKLLTKKGEEKWIDLTAGRIMFEGKPAAIGTAFDITERKKAELLQDAVYRIAQAADRSKRLDDLFKAVHAIIGEVMVARNFYIALYDRDADLITFPYYVDEYDEIFSEAIKPRNGLTEYILRTGKSLLCTSAMHHKLEQRGEVELIGTPSPIWLGVPLKVDNNVIGVMVVQHYSDPRVYGERERRILEFVSSQVAMVINRKKSEDALRASEERYRRRVDEMTALFETTRELATQQDITALLQTIVDRAASLLGSPAGSIYLNNAERHELEIMVAHGPKLFIGVRVKTGEGIAGQVARNLQPIVVNDYQKWEYRSEKFDALPICACVAIPMLFSGELLGVITLFELRDQASESPRTYSQSDVDLLTFFAGAAASAVYNTRLFSQIRQRLVELELLYQASLAAAQIHSRRAVAQRIVDTIENLLGWDSAIWLVDMDNQKPILLANSSAGLTGEAVKHEFERIGELIPSFEQGIVGWVCQHGIPVRTGDVGSNPNYIESNSRVKSELCVPLKVGGKTIGCIDVESEDAEAYSEHDERLLTTMANQAAVVIENARLFEETRRRAVRQAALNTIITAATRAGTDIDTILNTVLEQTLKALNLDMGSIWLISSPRNVQRVVSRGINPSISQLMANSSVTNGTVLTHNIIVSDWAEFKHPLSEPLFAMGVRAGMIVPLISEGKRIGGLAVASPEVHQWSSEEMALVETIGREIGAAAERAKLFDQTQTRLTELEAVNRISVSLRLAKTMDEMLPHLIEDTLKALDAESGGIWFYDPERDKLQQVIGRGWCTNISHLELEKSDSMPGTVFTVGDIYFSSDIYKDSRTSESMREFAPPGWSAVCVPIRAEHETIGVFLVSVRLPREFNGEDARLLVTLTEIAGNAIHRMHLNEQTERHAAELETRVADRTGELQAALQKAQAADRLKSEFIANINHELRTPLTNLVLYYQMLRAQPTVKTEERLNVIGRELQRLRNLIEDLLNLSRLDLGQVTIRPLPHDLNAMIQTLVDDRRSLAEERGLTLTTELRPDLPSVWLDEPMFIQAVSNLLTNALNYTPSGGHVAIRTMMEERNREPWIGLSVQDTGLGVNSDELPRLFERFYRGKAARESGAPGTGLGLAIVKQVTEFHHGKIEVQPGTDNRGVIFSIWLPLEENKQETRY